MKSSLVSSLISDTAIAPAISGAIQSSGLPVHFLPMFRLFLRIKKLDIRRTNFLKI
jgi:hypothetical protein